MSTEHADVLTVRAGISGIDAAYRLGERCPNKTLAILDGRAAIGGTWDLFRLPGIRSDSDTFTPGQHPDAGGLEWRSASRSVVEISSRSPVLVAPWRRLIAALLVCDLARGTGVTSRAGGGDPHAVADRSGRGASSKGRVRPDLHTTVEDLIAEAKPGSWATRARP